MSQIQFTAYLKAAPQGSKRHVGKGRMIESSKHVNPYRNALAQIAHIEKGKQDWYFPDNVVGLTLDFYFLRPKSARGRIHHNVKPDLDKLVRATGDALTGILFTDDSQIVEINARKHYCTVERVEISCYTLSRSEPSFVKEVSDETQGSTNANRRR